MTVAVIDPRSRPRKVLMLVHDRPVYTYMTLDSVRRATRSPYRLTVYHHRVEPTQNDDVIDSFRRRGVVSHVIEQDGPLVDWKAVERAVFAMLDPGEPFAFFLESDVVIETTDGCWLAEMAGALTAHPDLARVGSAIDKSDFIDPASLERDLGRPLTLAERQIIKAASPERHQSFAPGQTLFTGHNVAGRFFGMRIAAATRDLPRIDSLMDAVLRDRGWTTAILSTVRHRHLSLQNYYDYPEYAEKRERHVENARR